MSNELTGEQHLLSLIVREFLNATRKHPTWPRDAVHAAAIVAKEMGELHQAAFDFAYRRYPTKDRMAKEARQLAAMAVRFHLNLERLELPNDEPCPGCTGTGYLCFPGRTFDECALCRGTGRVPKS